MAKRDAPKSNWPFFPGTFAIVIYAECKNDEDEQQGWRKGLFSKREEKFHSAKREIVATGQLTPRDKTRAHNRCIISHTSVSRLPATSGGSKGLAKRQSFSFVFPTFLPNFFFFFFFWPSWQPSFVHPLALLRLVFHRRRKYREEVATSSLIEIKSDTAGYVLKLEELI